MKQLSKILFVVFVLTLSGCTNNTLKNNNSEKTPLNDIFTNIENGATITLTDEYSFSGTETFTIEINHA